MTSEQARAILHLREDDRIDSDGLSELIETTRKYLSVWSISKQDREQAELELSAMLFLKKGESK